MKPMLWKPEYAIHDVRVDAQHIQLFELYNQVCSAPMASVDQEKLIHDLYSYAIFHFAEEEALMATERYPEPQFEHHRRSHASFFASVERLRAQSLETALVFFQEWLVHHILTEDRAIGEFLVAPRKTSH